jgi:hypothetical protein
LIGEQFAGSPGGYWGRERALSQERAVRDFEEGQRAQEAALLYSDEQARRNLLESAASRALQAGTGIRGLTQEAFGRQAAIQQAEALPRMLDQAQLDWNYKEFLRTRPETAPYMQLALQFLGIPMLTQMGVQGQQGKSGFNLGGMFGGGLSGGTLAALMGVTNPWMAAASIGAGALSGALS